MPTPEDAVSYAESDLMPFKVFALIDDDGAVWWRKQDDEGKWSPVFECSIGDRTMHIDELCEGKWRNG